jgi:kinesin family protein 6/9
VCFLSYKETFAQLKTLKSEIEHLQHFLERSKVQLMKDFELWWAEQMSSVEGQQQHHSSQQQDVV